VHSRGRCASRSHPYQHGHDGNLPNDVSSFLGRREDIDRVADKLRDARLVTLTGVGGVGKTRLALQVVKELRAARSYNAWVTLSSVADDVRVAETITGVLGALDWSIFDASSSDAAGDGLLLILDGCEHVIAACAEFVDRLLRACAGVRVLATSREPLGVPGEIVFPVSPLPVPEPGAPPDCQMKNEAVELFVERARARGAEFQLSHETIELVARICRSLDGIPLAIELAAARITTMTLADIAGGLDDPVGLLTGGGRAAPQRHQSLRASLDWSYALLQDPERRLLRRLAIFNNGFTVEAARSVCAADNLPRDHVASLLDRLCAQSLVQTCRQAGTIRFVLFETVRRYAAELLEQAGEETTVRERHFSWCLTLAHRLSYETVEPLEVSRLEVEEGNIRSALRWTIDSSLADVSSQLALALGRLWLLRRPAGPAWNSLQHATALIPSRSLVTVMTAEPEPGSKPAPEATESSAVNGITSENADHNAWCDQAPVPFLLEGRRGTLEARWPVRNSHSVETQLVAATPENNRILDAEASLDGVRRADELDESVPEVAGDGGNRQRSTVLSERELAVALLVADGRSNREIADELVISRKTAEAHVSHILTKLGLWRRVQIATWTLQHSAGAA
jgi:predicted ATPase/DNA-binding CsgD family transcriptional regulator